MSPRGIDAGGSDASSRGRGRGGGAQGAFEGLAKAGLPGPGAPPAPPPATAAPPPRAPLRHCTPGPLLLSPHSLHTFLCRIPSPGTNLQSLVPTLQDPAASLAGPPLPGRAEEGQERDEREGVPGMKGEGYPQSPEGMCYCWGWGDHVFQATYLDAQTPPGDAITGTRCRPTVPLNFVPSHLSCNCLLFMA